ncbi:MAG: LamG domain-containing protein [Alphaproteobacteria bacterium]|nr:LamG domain-containing protein [Alphaproteobacteria bacterium]
MKKHPAFSIIELSIVVLVIGIMMTIVAQSIKMTTNARLVSARTLTSRSPVPDIPGLVAWYETSKLESFKPSEAVDSRQISTWYDVSPGSVPKKLNTLTRTASSAVTYKLDGIGKLPSVYFNGTNRISVTSFYQGITSQNTVILVARPYVALSSTGIVFDSGNVARGCVLAFNPSNYYFSCITANNVSATINTYQDYVVAAYINGSSSKVYSNDVNNMASGSTVNIGSNSLDGLSIGSDRSGNYGLTGLVSEMIIYNRPLQAQERRDVMNYLSQKYGITVSGL